MSTEQIIFDVLISLFANSGVTFAKHAKACLPVSAFISRNKTTAKNADCDYFACVNHVLYVLFSDFCVFRVP